MTSSPLIFTKDQYFHEMLGIFYSVALCTYNWAFVVFFWQLPSLILSLNIGEIVAYAAYQLMFAFFESTLVAVVIILICHVLPAKYFGKNLLVLGSLLTFALAINSAYFRVLPLVAEWLSTTLPVNTGAAMLGAYGSWIYLLVSLPLCAALVARNPKISGRIRKFVENLSVLASLYVILSFFGTLIVFLRNIH